MGQEYIKDICTESTLKVLKILKENSHGNKVRLTENDFFELVNESILETLNEGKWLNRAAGLALGAASLFGGYNNAYADSGRDNQVSYNSYEQAMDALKKQGFKKKDITNNEVSKLLKYKNKDGRGQFTYYDGRDLSKSNLFVNPRLSANITSAIKQHDISLDKYHSIPNDTFQNASVEELNQMAKKFGFNENDYMLYVDNTMGGDGSVYFMPDTDNIQDLYQTFDLDSINGI